MSRPPKRPPNKTRSKLPLRPGFKGRGGRIIGTGDDRPVLYGWHPVVEALRNPKRKIKKFLATENAIRRLQEENVPLRITPEEVRAGEIDRLLTEDAVHQGLYLEAEPLSAPDIEDLPDNGLVLVLDQITDPHNVGAIVRTAAAFAVDAIVTTNRHSPAATGVLAKSASGGLEHVPIVTIRNLAEGLDELKFRGYRCIGLDSEAPEDLADIAMTRPLALVMGAEGKGLRQKTREHCDVLARMDMPGVIKSLNVSNATAIALYAARQKTK
jgi:23S rRNA (guanosine2251-2'-O)-methyltransferase